MAVGLIGLNSPVSRAWRKYNISLKQAPITTKAVTCMAAYAVGDLSAQLLSKKTVHLHRRIAAVDTLRVARAALYGLLWCGPACHSFYARLDRVFAQAAPSSVASIAGKVAIDQLLFSPICTAVFFAWSNLAAGTPANIRGDLRDKLPPSVRAAWALWVPAMTVNMAVVPPELRLLFINAVSIVWTNMLSSMAGAAAPEAPRVMPADVAIVADAGDADAGAPWHAPLQALLLGPHRRISSMLSAGMDMLRHAARTARATDEAMAIDAKFDGEEELLAQLRSQLLAATGGDDEEAVPEEGDDDLALAAGVPVTAHSAMLAF